MKKSKRPYPEFPDYPNCYKEYWYLWDIPDEYPDGPIGVAIDRMHRLNRFALQYGNLFLGGDHFARFYVHDFLGLRRTDAPTYVRAVEGLTLDTLYDYYRIFLHEVAPRYAFINIGLEELKQPTFDTEEFFLKLRHTVVRFCVETPTLRTIYMTPLFPVRPGMATPETAPAFKYLTNERIQAFNKRLKYYVDTLEDRFHGVVGVEYLDLNEDLTDPEGQMHEFICDDGIHLTPDGYRRVFDKVKEIISYEPGHMGSLVPEDNTLRLISRIQALEKYVIERNLMSRDELMSWTDAFRLQELSTARKLEDLGRFLPDSDLRELAKYIVHYTEDPLDVVRKYSPQELEPKPNIIEFPTDHKGGNEK